MGPSAWARRPRGAPWISVLSKPGADPGVAAKTGGKALGFNVIWREDGIRTHGADNRTTAFETANWPARTKFFMGSEANVGAVVELVHWLVQTDLWEDFPK